VSRRCSESETEEVVFADGKVSAKGQSCRGNRRRALPAAGITSHGEWRADLQARGVHGVCFAEVEVDVETGHVKPIKMVHIQDGGLPLNRLTMESQINGGMIQSLGWRCGKAA
jgi:CO/xanthine dehydrogenase Mo-binding subunit